MNIDQSLKHEEKMGDANTEEQIHDTPGIFSFNKKGKLFKIDQL